MSDRRKRDASGCELESCSDCDISPCLVLPENSIFLLFAFAVISRLIRRLGKRHIVGKWIPHSRRATPCHHPLYCSGAGTKETATNAASAESTPEMSLPLYHQTPPTRPAPQEHKGNETTEDAGRIPFTVYLETLQGMQWTGILSLTVPRSASLGLQLLTFKKSLFRSRSCILIAGGKGRHNVV